MARRFTRPFMYDFIGRSNRALWGSQKPQRIGTQQQSFQRTLQAGHCLIAPGPADLSVGFRTVAIVTPIRRWSRKRDGHIKQLQEKIAWLNRGIEAATGSLKTAWRGSRRGKRPLESLLGAGRNVEGAA